LKPSNFAATACDIVCSTHMREGRFEVPTLSRSGDLHLPW